MRLSAVPRIVIVMDNEPVTECLRAGGGGRAWFHIFDLLPGASFSFDPRRTQRGRMSEDGALPSPPCGIRGGPILVGWRPWLGSSEGWV